MHNLNYSDDFLLLPLMFFDLILGFQWLLPVGHLNLKFQQLTLGYTYQGEDCILKRSVDIVRTVEVKRLDKMAKLGVNCS